MKKTLILAFVSIALNISAQVPFQMNKNGHIIIKAKLNNIEGNFILDTGAGINVVFKNFSKKLSNTKTPNFFVGHRATGEPIEADLYNANSLEIGTEKFPNQQYSIIDLDFGDIDGLISLQPFRNTPVTIDYNTQNIYFNKKIKSKKYIDIQLADEAGKSLDIFTWVKLNNKINIQVELDSGSGKDSYWFSSKLFDYLSINKDTFEKKAIKSEFNPKVENYFYIGKSNDLSTINNFSFVKDFNVVFVDGLIYEGKTSINWLGKVLTIDIFKKKIFIED